ncbi:Hypothetical predicted protein [Pelobates cultripes]|uniref:Uncharacterized protein n=1 Tax=Pelobates cultripes TaxID=61616 RepID=A0AAD1SHS6_PELCU|nr:Hypothetical predicted protein [Pelobates cultripes]
MQGPFIYRTSYAEASYLTQHCTRHTLAWPHGRATVGECRRETCDRADGSEGADSQERRRKRHDKPSRQWRRVTPQQNETQEMTRKYGDPRFGASHEEQERRGRTTRHANCQKTNGTEEGEEGV